MTNPTNEGLQTAVTVARALLSLASGKGTAITDAVLDGVVEKVQVLQTHDEPFDAAELRRVLLGEVDIYVGMSDVIADPDDDHRDWLDGRRGQIDWDFWRDLRTWSLQSLPNQVVASTDTLSDEILGLLEDPTRPGGWDRRGMVVGQVQSGKTGNYTALIAKAADAGYKFIVVLAGLHNSLRSQTQARLDEGFLGLDSQAFIKQSNRKIGVGAMATRHPSAWTFTSSDEQGDFRKAVASRLAGQLGSTPVIVVVKKNARVLKTLIEWVTQNNGTMDPESGRLVVRGVPLLVIDDEADNASVNTKEIEYEEVDGEIVDQTDPSKINRLIRQLLHSFESSSLVSYTATPFANIFIDDGLEPNLEVGEDLFPRSFILRMPAPSNYLGPAQVFGLGATSQVDAVDPLPVIRRVRAVDIENWLPTGHRKDAVPSSLPTSLRTAVRAFVLTCAARQARGQINVHNSMLVHVTRFVDVQSRVAELVRAELDTIRDSIVYGDQGDEIGTLQDLWRDDYEKTFAAMPAKFRGTEISWEDVSEHLADAVRRIKVREINGTAGDALEYSEHPDGASVIAVGGDKLSRGLTLEGLSVSYYLRPSKMYDTLLQMGRWFGYRPNYADLIRLYTTGELVDWYRQVATANRELEDKFDEMASANARPKDFSLYVRQSPDGLLVTARSKMRSGRLMKLSFSGDVVETVSFERDAAVHAANLGKVARFVEAQKAAGRPATPGSSLNWIWNGVPGQEVAELLDAFATSDRALKARGRLLATYVRARLADAPSELRSWTVVLVNNSKTENRVSVGDLSVGLTERSPLKNMGPTHYSIQRIGSPTDELIDLDAEQLAGAIDLTVVSWEQAIERNPALKRKRPTTASAVAARQVRSPRNGLLLLYLLDHASTGVADDNGESIPQLSGPVPGFLVSFPHSPNAEPIEYQVPGRYWEREA